MYYTSLWPLATSSGTNHFTSSFWTYHSPPPSIFSHDLLFTHDGLLTYLLDSQLQNYHQSIMIKSIFNDMLVVLGVTEGLFPMMSFMRFSFSFSTWDSIFLQSCIILCFRHRFHAFFIMCYRRSLFILTRKASKDFWIGSFPFLCIVISFDAFIHA